MSKVIRRIDGTLIVPKSTELNPEENDEVYAKKLINVVDELQIEQEEYKKFNQQLYKNAVSVYEANEILKEAIKDRKANLARLTDNYSKSIETLEQETLENEQIAKEYYALKQQMSNAKQINKDDSYMQAEMQKIERELNDIEKSANDLIKKLPDTQKRIHLYQILLSLLYKLAAINDLFLCEARNCEGELDSKIASGAATKKELALQDVGEGEVHLTKSEVDRLFHELSGALRIYKRVIYILQKKSSSEKVEDDEKSGTEEGKGEVTLEEEREELLRIVQGASFGYLNDPSRAANQTDLFNLFTLIGAENANHKKGQDHSQNSEHSEKVDNLSEKVVKENENDNNDDLNVNGLDDLKNGSYRPNSSASAAKKGRKSGAEHVDVMTSVDPSSFMSKKKASTPSKPRKKSTYDPSIFYTNAAPAATPSASGRLRVKGDYVVKLAVTLKDIGLEGLDSATPDKAYRLRMKEQERERKEGSSKASKKK